jgi:hypothetical protein
VRQPPEAFDGSDDRLDTDQIEGLVVNEQDAALAIQLVQGLGL